jgi:thioredoxin-like negative regulator of GroEL
MKGWLFATAVTLAVFAATVDFWSARGADSEGEIVSEYSGANQGHAVLEEAQKRSKGKTVFLMFYHPDCDHCVRLTAFFREAKPKTKLNFTVLRVNARAFPEPSRVFQQTVSVPETFVVQEGRIRGRWLGAQKTVDDLVKLLDRIERGELDRQPGTPR